MTRTGALLAVLLCAAALVGCSATADDRTPRTTATQTSQAVAAPDPAERGLVTAAEPFTGEGLLFLPLSEEPVSIAFQNLGLVKDADKVAVKKNALVGMTDFSITKGAARLKLSQVLVGPDGLLADGQIFIKETKETPGIGPLYFYGVTLDPDGFSGEVVLESPQKGSLGDIDLEIDKVRFSFGKSRAQVKAEGSLLLRSSGRSVDLRLPLVLETLSGGRVRMGGGAE